MPQTLSYIRWYWRIIIIWCIKILHKKYMESQNIKIYMDVLLEELLQ